MSRRLVSLVVCLLALASPALVTGAPRAVRDDVVLKADSSGMDWSRVPEYRIVPGDLLVLNFGPLENATVDLLREQPVRPDGRISVFPIGDVVAAGRTPRELEQALVDLLSAEIRSPRLSVQIREYAGNKVHVLGQVRMPGSYPAGPFMTTLQAIAASGGFLDDAARNSVLVFHRDGASTVRVTRLRLHDALKSGRLDGDLPLSRFDIVYVPRSSIGNLNVFAKQFFGEQLQVVNFALVGWELFNLDRVFVIGSGEVRP